MRTVSFKVAEDIKEQSQKIFDEIGLSFSGAINIFLKACIKNEGIPFELSTKKSYEDIILDRIKEADCPKNLSPTFKNIKEAEEWLNA